MYALAKETREQVCAEMKALKDMGECPMLTWGQVRVLAAGGYMQFAPHTVRHVLMEELSVTEARQEILDSRQRILEETGAVCPVFAYPAGHVPPNVPALFAGTQIPFAVTTRMGSNSIEADPLQLARWDTGYCLVDGAFHAGYFHLRTSGMFRS